LLLAVRLHWRLGLAVAIVASLALVGLAIAQGPELAQTRRIAITCASARLTAGQAARPAIAYAASRGFSVAKRRRTRCHGRAPEFVARLSSQAVVERPPPETAQGVGSDAIVVASPAPPEPQVGEPPAEPEEPEAPEEPEEPPEEPPVEPPPPDTTPPQTSIIGGPAPLTTSTSANLSFSSSESGSSFECELDGAGWAGCSSPKGYAGIAVGPHQFTVRAIDATGNVDSSPATRSWTVEAPSPPPPPPPPPAECSTVVTSVSSAQSAISAAVPGEVVCLADGSYEEVSLSATKSAEVTLQAEHPGLTTIAGATLDGSHLTISRFNITNEVTVQPGATAMTVEYNRISGGYMGINAGPTTSESISDTTIRGNQLIGPFGEDALRINRYHDSSDPDPYGILIEGNEISGVRENGNHSDCLQSVWGGDGLYFRRNYLHDNRCQGFFVKDQPSTVEGIALEDNLFLRNSEPCAPEASGCGQPSYLQIFGPYQNLTMRRNTVWQGEVVASFQEGAGTGTTIESNVVDRFWTNTNLSGIAYSDNTRCEREATAGGSWPAQAPGEIVDCAPAFNDPASDDFRLIGSDRGVDWAPAEQHYGP
jgi:hypothetical protein